MAQVLKQSMLGMLKKQGSQSEWSGVKKTGIHRKQTIEVAEEEEQGRLCWPCKDFGFYS